VADHRTVVLVSGFIAALVVGCDAGQSAHHTSSGGGGAGVGGATSSSGSTTTTTSSSTTTTSTSSAASSSGSVGPGLHVSGNKLMEGTTAVRLLGVDQSGSEYNCMSANGIFDGSADQSSIDAMKAWHINTVRLPLNEDCWLEINGPMPPYAGPNYQSVVANYVNLIRQNGMFVILDLHWNAGGTNKASGQQQMADSDHALDFWKGVAGMFKGDTGVIFDLYNEPHDISWTCWKSGGCTDNGWPVAGMDQMIMAVRGTGAMNIVMAGGVAYSGDLSQWLANKPNDPAGQLAASFHTYNFTGCADTNCWNSQVAPVAAQVPVITGELGENDCGTGYINNYMAWADGQGISYLGWAWNADFDCGKGPALITNPYPTPTAFGAGFKAHLLMVNP
jgi:hypothetical protein